jgi:hypothetical protein
MSVRRMQGKEDRSQIAERIVELSDGVLSKENKLSYIALKVGPRVAAVVSKSDRVQFMIPSTDLLHKLTEKRFTLEKAPKSIPMHEHKYYFRGLRLNDINDNEPLFREIVQESVRTLRPKGN